MDGAAHSGLILPSHFTQSRQSLTDTIVDQTNLIYNYSAEVLFCQGDNINLAAQQESTLKLSYIPISPPHKGGGGD